MGSTDGERPARQWPLRARFAEGYPIPRVTAVKSSGAIGHVTD
jgi:hypothetical protein